jgi:hypothetical protein
MTSFQDKERAEESRYAFNQEIEFKIIARRNKLFGLWAAEQMQISGDEAQNYAKSVVLVDFEEEGDDDVITKVQHDLESNGMVHSNESLQEKLHHCYGEARKQFDAS